MGKTKRGLGKGLGAFFGEEVFQDAGKGREDRENTKRNHVERTHNGSENKRSAVLHEEKEKKQASINDTALIQEKERSFVQEKEAEAEAGKETTLKISKIEPNREQPRKAFHEEQLQELAESIKHYGILQPLLVQKKGDFYEIIAGERRWRAAQLAGLKEVPVVIREYSEQQAVEIALIENVQREDLNPIEEAAAYQRLIQEFHLKQDEIAERVSKNRATIANSMRLLNLCPEVQQMVIEGKISSGHARALLGVEDAEVQWNLAKKIEKDHLSVREVEKMVKLLSKPEKKKKEKTEDEQLALIFRDLEDRMKTVMGTKVNISRKDKNKGRIEIEYYSETELERIVELIESIQA